MNCQTARTQRNCLKKTNKNLKNYLIKITTKPTVFHVCEPGHSRISMKSCLFSAMVFRLFPPSSIILEMKTDTMSQSMGWWLNQVFSCKRRPQWPCTFYRNIRENKVVSHYLVASKRYWTVSILKELVCLLPELKMQDYFSKGKNSYLLWGYSRPHNIAHTSLEFAATLLVQP